MAQTPPADPPAQATTAELGPVYTRGAGFRARAEARQRAVRAAAGWAYRDHGHWLSDEAADAGANFVHPVAHAAARARAAAGKGVGDRTFFNMLSSQAMCFNLFAPLAADLELAGAVLGPLLPGLRQVRSISIEHTPAADLFGDQRGQGGVDCDLLIEAEGEAGPEIIVVETKFVEPEFSVCGHCKPDRAAKGKPTCSPTVPVAADRRACAYVSRNGFRYWEQTDALGTLLPLPAEGCPFRGAHWQLWVNHTLAHAEAARRGASRARLLVCAAEQNDALLQQGAVLRGFVALLGAPETVGMLALDRLIEQIGAVVGEEDGWVKGLRGRYGGI